MDIDIKQLIKTKVIIADDHELFADGVEQIVNNTDGFEVIAKVNNGKLLMQKLNWLRPDIILLDINMPFMNGFESAASIRKTFSNLKIIFISSSYDLSYKQFVKDNDVNGFLIKNVGAIELRAALRDVIAGKKVFIPPAELQAVAVTTNEPDFIKKYKLTRTELEIIEHIAGGDSNKMIADKRNLSVLTVESHRKNIFRKLGARNMADVTAFAVMQGIYKNR